MASTEAEVELGEEELGDVDGGGIDAAEAAADVDEELEEMKNKVKAMEEEAKKLREIQEQVEEQMQEGAEGEGGEDEAGLEADSRSVYVGNVDYSATPEELQELFAECGTVNRVTILCDKFKNPKGFAYIEFAEVEAVEAAVGMTDTELKGRQIKVTAKRTNVPGMGKGGRGRGRGRGRGPPRGGKGYGGYGGYGGKGFYGGYRPMYRPRYRRGYRPY